MRLRYIAGDYDYGHVDVVDFTLRAVVALLFALIDCSFYVTEFTTLRFVF